MREIKNQSEEKEASVGGSTCNWASEGTCGVSGKENVLEWGNEEGECLF